MGFNFKGGRGPFFWIAGGAILLLFLLGNPQMHGVDAVDGGLECSVCLRVGQIVSESCNQKKMMPCNNAQDARNSMDTVDEAFMKWGKPKIEKIQEEMERDRAARANGQYGHGTNPRSMSNGIVCVKFRGMVKLTLGVGPDQGQDPITFSGCYDSTFTRDMPSPGAEPHKQEFTFRTYVKVNADELYVCDENNQDACRMSESEYAGAGSGSLPSASVSRIISCSCFVVTLLYQLFIKYSR